MRHSYFTVTQVHFIDHTQDKTINILVCTHVYTKISMDKTLNTNKRDEVLRPQVVEKNKRERVYNCSAL